MKKNYSMPQAEVKSTHIRATLLAGSGENGGNSNPGLKDQSAVSGGQLSNTRGSVD